MKLNSEEKSLMAKIGSLGGKATYRKHGAKHYRKLAAHMNSILAKRKARALIDKKWGVDKSAK